MATYSYASLTLDQVPEAERLIDLTSINRDLSLAAEYAKRALSAMASAASEDFEVLMLAAFVRYGRCFNSGVRVPVQRELTLVLGTDSAHAELCDIRDGAYAHSIGRAESYDLRVWLNPPEKGGPGIRNVNVAEERVACDAHYLRHLLRLCDIALRWTAAEIEKEQSQILTIIQARFKLAHLYERSAGATGTATLKDARISRKRR